MPLVLRLTRARPHLPPRSSSAQDFLRCYSKGSDNPGTAESSHLRRAKNPKRPKQEQSKDGDGETEGTSLYEQLFPEQRKESELPRDTERYVPHVPLHENITVGKRIFKPATSFQADNDVRPSAAARRLERQMLQAQRDSGPVESVLVLRNASKNLMEEDFKRLTPHGRHMEGWKMEENDFIKVIPGRDVKTLGRLNYYYLIFSSALSAFTYQGHAIRLHRLVFQQTPQSMLSPIAPPPGYMVNGIDAHQALEKFTLVPPNASLDLRQLKAPLPPLVDSIVRHRGYASLVSRPERCPYEARLTLDGPRVALPYLRYVFMRDGQDRGLSWSGADDAALEINEWDSEAQFIPPSPMRSGRNVEPWRRADANGTHTKTNVDESDDPESGNQEESSEYANLRSSEKVYVVGFQTERAMQSFVRHWHRRPLGTSGVTYSPMGDEDDLPPILNVEVLW